ncbi:MAG: nucleotide-binding protein, partial [Chloroflexota bacterium]
MTKIPERREESLGGYIVHGVPFPVSTDEESLAFLKMMAPIQIEQPYQITYLHSYGQDSPWFAGLANKKLLASQDPESGYTYASPRGHDMYSGEETNWIDIT